ncbi:hypothetical protein S40293_07830 [Stachybotrys chartarum IBT 40293]|nr:hypothetical protein S40293_07830 [Stachybotrys chartarum IBT 40293]
MTQYPGLSLALRYFDPSDQLSTAGAIYPMGISADCWGSQSEMLLVREAAMMIVMDQLSEKPLWYEKVHDNSIADKWIEEGLAIPVQPLYDTITRGKIRERLGSDITYPRRLPTLLNRQCMEYCIQELRAKAEYYKKTGLIPTLDASATVVKSDVLVDKQLHEQLQAAFATLQKDQAASPDWHPKTDGKVQNLLHPSMYPLVYGKSRVFQEEVVGVEDAIDRWAGKGTVIRTQPAYDTRGGALLDAPAGNLWSATYQWLPSNVKFQDDGSVRFTSYINNLHPVKYRSIYRVLEKLIEKALPAWDLCVAPYEGGSVASSSAGRTQPRFPMPDKPDDLNDENWDPPFDNMEWPLPEEEASQTQAEDDAASSAAGTDDEEQDEEEEEFDERDSEGNWLGGTKREIHWQKTRTAVQPEPPAFEAWNYGVKPGMSLREKFKDLQVIVKMASIELTPEKPDFPQGSWHVEGLLNEKIVGTALYYLDSENITTSHLDFRMQTDHYQTELMELVGQDRFSWLQLVYGTNLRNAPCLQNYGSVETKQGRLVAFPNTFQHRVSPFELKDKTKPGHRRFIAIWLVDPLTRIISTANVPPQQQNWWLDQAFGKLRVPDANKVPQPIAKLILERAPGDKIEALQAAANGRRELPPVVLEMVRSQFGDALPMSDEEAKEHRLKLMDERTSTEKDTRDQWSRREYNFCEH